MKILRSTTIVLIGLAASAAMLAGCDHGLKPPDEPETGVLRARIEYAQGPGEWPPSGEVHDLRFVAMRFVPQDTTDLVQLNRMVFSQGLQYGVSEETVIITNVESGPFVYAGVAQKFGADLFAWRPVGLVTANDGVFVVSAGDTTDVRVVVDFSNPPPFPPPAP